MGQEFLKLGLIGMMAFGCLSLQATATQECPEIAMSKCSRNQQEPENYPPQTCNRCEKCNAKSERPKYKMQKAESKPRKSAARKVIDGD